MIGSSKYRYFVKISHPVHFSRRLILKMQDLLPRTTCLHKALIFKFIFRNDSKIKLLIGIKKGEGGLESHAWIEREGEVLINNLEDLGSYNQIFCKQ